MKSEKKKKKGSQQRPKVLLGTVCSIAGPDAGLCICIFFPGDGTYKRRNDGTEQTDYTGDGKDESGR